MDTGRPTTPLRAVQWDSASLEPSTRSASPAPGKFTKYRESMANAMAATQAKLSENKSDGSRPSTGISADKRPKTATFVLPEDDTEGVEEKRKRIEEREQNVKKVMEGDMKIKFRIRAAKLFLRCLNFGCSLVVLALAASSFAIFFATKNLANRNNLPPWAPQSILWPTYATLVIACISLLLAIGILISYWRGGHEKAENASLWFTAFTIFGFLFMIILWAVVAGTITNARNNSDGVDMWAWACKDNQRKELFKDDVDYDLVCKQLDWTFVCSIIEIVIESLAIILYVAAFFRFASKTRLRKSMDLRDKARHELYLRKLADGDEDVYRPTEHEMKTTTDVDLAERGYSVYMQTTVVTVGAPIIDPNSGLPLDPRTGEAVKPLPN
ncbi:hypothetical protein DRE_06623 [Drechslerella stenobrocha 248]|uniref:MARVEL domain-containing protein n=1 Tax=Drechslerella stenobrocha 248 TaxID=1043628 RepID=W7HNC4_9PEZI|nr:hypothetical protein DRE_06623 [Drechslerella stenobrocha 248]